MKKKNLKSLNLKKNVITNFKNIDGGLNNQPHTHERACTVSLVSCFMSCVNYSEEICEQSYAGVVCKSVILC